MYTNLKSWRQVIVLSFALVGLYAVLHAAPKGPTAAPKANTNTSNTNPNTSNIAKPQPMMGDPNVNTGPVGTETNTTGNTSTGNNAVDTGVNTNANTAVPEVNNPNTTTQGTVKTQPKGPTNAPGAKGTHVVTNDVTGTVQSFSQSGATSRVRIRDANGKVTEYTVDDRTSIFFNDSKTSLTQLRAGDEVTLRRSATR